MMILDHIATSIVATALVARSQKNILLYVAIVAAIAPDILVLFYHPGSIDYLYHRRYTNSLIFMPFYAVVIASIFYFFTDKTKVTFLLLYVVAVMNYSLHIVFDWITPFGSPLFFPLSDDLYSLDILHSFDPIYLFVSSLVIVLFIHNRIKNKLFSTNVLWFFVFLYLLHIIIMFTMKIYIGSTYSTYMENNYKTAIYKETIPKTYWRWRGIAEENGKYIIFNGSINNIQKQQIFNINMVPPVIKQDSYLVKFLEYARYPSIAAKDKSMEIYNAIYSPNSYRLIYELDDNGSISSKSILGFDLKDK